MQPTKLQLSQIWSGNFWTRLCCTNDDAKRNPVSQRPSTSHVVVESTTEKRVRFNEELEIIPVPKRSVFKRIYQPCLKKTFFVLCWVLYFLCFPCIECLKFFCPCDCLNAPVLDSMNGPVQNERYFADYQNKRQEPKTLENPRNNSKPRIEIFIV